LSRIGKNPIPIPEGVKVDIQGDRVSIEGPKGRLTRKLRREIKVSLKDKEIVVERTSDRRFDRSLHGLSRTLIANMVQGVTQGYKRILEIKGIGYKAEAKGKILNLNLGFSLPILFIPPPIRPDAMVFAGILAAAKPPMLIKADFLRNSLLFIFI